MAPSCPVPGPGVIQGRENTGLGVSLIEDIVGAVAVDWLVCVSKARSHRSCLLSLGIR